MFRPRLDEQLNMKYPLIRLAGLMGWELPIDPSCLTRWRQRIGEAGLMVSMRAMPGNPYDGHTLDESIEQVGIVANQRPRTVMVDKGYKGEDVDGV